MIVKPYYYVFLNSRSVEGSLSAQYNNTIYTACSYILYLGGQSKGLNQHLYKVTLTFQAAYKERN